jgi:hypothetical protein
MLVLSPAYGRDYRSQKAVKEDWNAGKDFIIESIGPNVGRYVNKPQIEGQKVQIRYQNLTKVIVI